MIEKSLDPTRSEETERSHRLLDRAKIGARYLSLDQRIWILLCKKDLLLTAAEERHDANEFNPY